VQLGDDGTIDPKADLPDWNAAIQQGVIKADEIWQEKEGMTKVYPIDAIRAVLRLISHVAIEGMVNVYQVINVALQALGGAQYRIELAGLKKNLLHFQSRILSSLQSVKPCV